jgi:hypothetical protein
LGENAQQNRLTTTNENHHHTNILGPKHFIVEEENEALLAKELQEAKIQSSHNSHSSMHSSQPHLFNVETTDFCIRNPNVREKKRKINYLIKFFFSFHIVINRSFSIAFQIIIIFIYCYITNRKKITKKSFWYSTNAFYNWNCL